MSFILASASRTRKDMLAQAGLRFTVQPADLDEAALMAGLGGVAADAVAARLALEKALAISRGHPGALVLGADSVLAFDGEIISKAPDMASARALLQRLCGKTHQLVSAAALVRDGAPVWAHADTVRLAMRDFTPAFLDDYLAREGEAILSSVGCYRFEGLGAQLFDRVEGDYFAILGLPLLPLLTALRGQGILAA